MDLAVIANRFFWLYLYFCFFVSLSLTAVELFACWVWCERGRAERFWGIGAGMGFRGFDLVWSGWMRGFYVWWRERRQPGGFENVRRARGTRCRDTLEGFWTRFLKRGGKEGRKEGRRKWDRFAAVYSFIHRCEVGRIFFFMMRVDTAERCPGDWRKVGRSSNVLLQLKNVIGVGVCGVARFMGRKT